ncbi:hypothetical protein J7I97_16950 [Streptomyces sp. ISL-87]|uniref:hypothetical protein n=1 Tax=Streptomyces sp. ISL-87 TaxID=2819188 RepID=UPI001BE74DE1|nr:hypothetical protein [Streptomyces sp. ISL-87]MBT2609916.1 hypothetical protein [Streptomyces sp. ISL-87]
MSTALPWYVKAVLRVAIPAACLAALFLSIPGEIAMARAAGWSETYSYAMPICVSVYALAAAAIAAYRRRAGLPGQVTALIGAAVALLLAICAQSISHLMAQDYMGTSAVLVVAVSSVPPLVIAHMMHMAETPSQELTASEEMEIMKRVISSYMEETSGTLLDNARTLMREYDYLTARAGELAGEAREEALAADSRLRRPTAKRAAASEAEIRAAAQALKAKGEKLTGANLAAVLGVAESTGYRYRQIALTP